MALIRVALRTEGVPFEMARRQYSKREEVSGEYRAFLLMLIQDTVCCFRLGSGTCIEISAGGEADTNPPHPHTD